MEEWFSKGRSKEHLERSDKAGMSLSQPQRDKTAHLFYLISVTYVVVAMSTFTLLKLLSDWSALWLFSCSKELSRSALRTVTALLLSKQKHSLNFKMLTYCSSSLGFSSVAWATLVPERCWIWKGQCEEVNGFQGQKQKFGECKEYQSVCVCMHVWYRENQRWVCSGQDWEVPGRSQLTMVCD